jgi:2,4-dienoyl-CoA reductase-like NADH-dependent reductase (Old Yellow Enzyme family)
VIDLFQPYRIGKLELGNRFVRSATWDATADGDGAVTDASVVLYEALARGGIGLIITGFAFVSAAGQAGFRQYGAHNDKMLPGLRRLVKPIHQFGGKIALQIHHGGISAVKTGQPALTVSKIPTINKPQHVMNEEDIESIINDFTMAAVRAREAGFDAVQLHGAHGYLMSQFLSPLTNDRTDRWGGSIENRGRFHIELIRRIRQAVGTDFPLLIKFGVRDESDAGLTLDDGVLTAQRMYQVGIDAIEVSAGSPSAGKRPAPTLKPGELERAFFRERSRAVKRAVNVPVILVGGIRSLALANDIVSSGDADLIAMSRPFIREPAFLKRWRENATKVVDCISCNRCFPPRPSDGSVVVCRQEQSPAEVMGG